MESVQVLVQMVIMRVVSVHVVVVSVVSGQVVSVVPVLLNVVLVSDVSVVGTVTDNGCAVVGNFEGEGDVSWVGARDGCVCLAMMFLALVVVL